MAFYIETTNAANVRQNGHFETVWGVEITREANRIGEIRFSVAADAFSRAGITNATNFLIYHAPVLPPYSSGGFSVGDGYLGSYRFRSAELDASGQVVSITAADRMRELADRIVGFRLAYTQGNNRLFHILDDLAARAGWTVVREAGLVDAEISCEFFGESFLTAFDTLRSYVRGWFSLSGDYTIRFGRFENFGYYETLYLQSDNAGVPVDTIFGVARYATQASAYKLQDVGAFLTNPELLSSRTKNSMTFRTGGVLSAEWTVRSGLITRLTKVTDYVPIVTRVYPIGAGVGTTQVDLRWSDITGPYAIGSYVGEDGDLVYYLENPTSVANYGIIERVLPFSDIRPISNSNADLREAANTLYALALAYLNRFSAPSEVYQIECTGIPELRPGDLVLIDYRGVVHTAAGNVSTVFIDKQPFYVTRIVTSYSEGGAKYSLTISSSGEEPATADTVVSQAVRDIERFKAHPQPSITYFDKASPTLPIDNLRNVEFVFEIGPEALDANSLQLEFHVMPLRSYATVAAVAGGVVDSETTTATAPIISSSAGGGVVNSSSGGAGDIENDTAIGGRDLAAGATGSSQSVFHQHKTFAFDQAVFGGAPAYLFYNNGDLLLSVGGGLAGYSLRTGIQDDSVSNGLIGHTHPIGTHNHHFTIGAHTHLLTIPAHTHDVDISNHTHKINVPAHSHALTFGVVDDTATPTELTVIVNGIAVVSIIDRSTKSEMGGSVSGAGQFSCDILPIVLIDSGWRTRQHRVLFRCVSGQGQVFAQIHGRLTIQPIQVVP